MNYEQEEEFLTNDLSRKLAQVGSEGGEGLAQVGVEGRGWLRWVRGGGTGSRVR